MFVKVTRSGSRRYVQLVEAYRHEQGVTRHRHVANLGRLEQAPEKLGWLIEGLCRVAERAVPAAMTFERSLEVGGLWLLKLDINIAPMHHHRLPERIRAHGLICFLALMLYRVMRPKLTDHSPSAALRQLKALQLHRLSAGGQSVRGISQAKDETRAILQQPDLPLP
jgi:hypothetical protein